MALAGIKHMRFVFQRLKSIGFGFIAGAILVGVFYIIFRHMPGKSDFDIIKSIGLGVGLYYCVKVYKKDH